VNAPGAIGLVWGSGLDLSGILDEVESRLAFENVPGLGTGFVPGHGYDYLRGQCGDRQVVLQRGRRHLYEGLPFEDTVRTVDALAEQGVRTVIFTNVVGGLRPEMEPGVLVAVDGIRLWHFRHWPNQPSRLEPDFAVPGCPHRGEYVWMHGPCYETRAEIRALQHLGGAVVGMSTAPELARCKALGVRAAVVSCVTNNCCRPQVLTHEHVVTNARRASETLVALLRRALPGLPTV